MSEEMIVQHCSPTLAGIKTGNLFSCSYTDESTIKNKVRELNKALGKKGLRVLLLRAKCGRALVYIFRPSRLRDDLRHATAHRLLAERGYAVQKPERCIAHLIRRIGEDAEFPHEIGLFLGYPPEDVCGFIENRAGGCKCVGCWKVYGDVETAQKLFSKYKKCTDVYLAHLAKGKSIERLTVAG